MIQQLNNVYLCGYELITNLDFDADGDGSTFIETSAGDCNVILARQHSPLRLLRMQMIDTEDTDDTEDAAATYFPADDTTDSTTNEGWLPIGDAMLLTINLLPFSKAMALLSAIFISIGI